MSHRTKSGQKRKRFQAKQRWKRRTKRQRAQLIADGKIKKGIAPASSAPQS